MLFADSSGLLILDGGLATELEKRGHDLSGTLWSASVLLDAPSAIEQLHYDYFAAGADCVVSASYQASAAGFAGLGLSIGETNVLLRRSVELGQSARQRYCESSADSRRLYVAASVGPFGATRHDGSEYHGNYGLSAGELKDFHAERFSVLAGSGADLLACETIPSLDEARVLAKLLSEHGDIPAWMSFTSHDGLHTAHGEPLEEIARLLDSIPNVVAVGVNCLAPNNVSPAIERLRMGTGKPIVVYPNSGEQWDAKTRCWHGAADDVSLAKLAPVWRQAGARLIGGCCRTGPADIAALVAVLR